jgi:hypothetical protein
MEKKVANLATIVEGKGARDAESSSRSWMIPAAVAVLVVLGTKAGGQTPQQPNQDTLGVLLVEVRGLRSAIEHMTTVGPSIQLAMGRLQLQEQRIKRSSAERTLYVTRLARPTSGPASCGTVWEICSERLRVALSL